MEEKNKHIRYYILFDNHTQGMMLHELLDKQGLPNRIAPAPRDTDGKAACGMALLIHPDDIDAVRTCIEENHAEYVTSFHWKISCRKRETDIVKCKVYDK